MIYFANSQSRFYIERTIMNQNQAPRRIIMLDSLRGFLLLLVIAFHLLYDLHFIFGVNTVVMKWDAIYIFRDCFVAVLIFISGICCNLSHNNILRGIKTLGCGLSITLVTFLFIPEERILFGILHFFGVAMIFYGVTAPLFQKINPYPGAIVCFLLFIATFSVNHLTILEIPFQGNVKEILRYLYFIVGFRTGLSSSDYYPMIPWLFIFLSGTFAGRNIKTKKLGDVFYKDCCKPLTWIGQHTLIIYLLHQPILYGALYCIFHFIV